MIRNGQDPHPGASIEQLVVGRRQITIRESQHHHVDFTSLHDPLQFLIALILNVAFYTIVFAAIGATIQASAARR